MSSIILDFPNKTTTIPLDSNDPFPTGYGDADFDVARGVLSYTTQTEPYVIEKTSSKHVLYRTDNGAELGIHGRNYTTNLRQLNYRTMIDNQREVIRSSGLNLEGLEEVISVGGNGEKCFVKHTLPNEIMKTPGGDTACLTFLGLSSLNGIWPVSLSCGANQSACQNNQIFVSGASMLYKHRHNQRLDIDKGYKLIAGSIDIFSQEVDLWHKWSNTPITDAEAFLMFAKAANCKYVADYRNEHGFAGIVPSQLTLEAPVYSNTALMYMFEDRWLTHYKPVLGSNYWAAYNTLTDWSSHGPQSKKGKQVEANNMANLRNDRSNKVIEVVKNTFSLAA